MLGDQFIAVDDTSVYYSAVNEGMGRIDKVATSGGPVTVLVCSSDWDGPFAIDDASLYWLTQGGAVMKTAKN